MAETPKKPKPSKATIAQRIEEILRIRLDGAEFWDVREYAREKEAEEGSAWHLGEGDKPLSDGQLRRYMARVDRLITESCRAQRKKLLRRHLAQRRNLYAKAVNQGDVRTALSILHDEAELLGLYERKRPLRVDVTSKGKRLVERDSLTAADVVAAAALVAAAGIGVPPDGRPQSVDSLQPAGKAAAVSSAL